MPTAKSLTFWSRSLTNAAKAPFSVGTPSPRDPRRSTGAFLAIGSIFGCSRPPVGVVEILPDQPRSGFTETSARPWEDPRVSLNYRGEPAKHFCSGAFAEGYYKNVTKEAILVPRSEISAPVIAHIYLSACGTASAEPREDPELEHRTAAIHQQTP